MPSDGEKESELLSASVLTERWETLRQAASRDEKRCVSVIYVDHLDKIEKRYGKSVATAVYMHAARLLQRRFSPKGYVGRWNDRRLVAITIHLEQFEVVNLLTAIQTEFKRIRFRPKEAKPFRTSLTAGVITTPFITSLPDGVNAAVDKLRDILDYGVSKVVSLGAMQGRFDETILLAEDDELVASMVKHRLARDGLKVVHFANGAEALQAARNQVYSLVLLDVKMPGMNGFDVLQQIRAIDEYNDAPIIMMTSIGGDADIVKAFKYGADDYVVKPHAPEELNARVQRLLRKKMSR